MAMIDIIRQTKIMIYIILNRRDSSPLIIFPRLARSLIWWMRLTGYPFLLHMNFIKFQSKVMKTAIRKRYFGFTSFMVTFFQSSLTSPFSWKWENRFFFLFLFVKVILILNQPKLHFGMIENERSVQKQ